MLANNAQSLRFFIDDKVRLLVRIYLKNKARLDHNRNIHPFLLSAVEGTLQKDLYMNKMFYLYWFL